MLLENSKSTLIAFFSKLIHLGFGNLVSDGVAWQLRAALNLS